VGIEEAGWKRVEALLKRDVVFSRSNIMFETVLSSR